MLLITGATGFVGSHVVAEQLRAHPDEPVRVLRRTPPAAAERDPRVDVHLGDLADPASLAGIGAGVTRVVHAAGYIGSDAERNERVNLAGTEALLGAVDGAHVLQVSTTAVYADVPHHGVGVDASLGPASPTSASRLAAEGLVRAAGGSVVRPHMVYGTGDRWFVPTVVTILRAVGGQVGDGRARMSVVAVMDLARALVGVSRLEPDGRVLHAAEPAPISQRELVEVLAAEPGLLGATDPVEEAEARRRLGSTHPALVRHLSRLTSEKCYDSRELSGLVPRVWPSHFSGSLASHLSWYARFCGSLDGGVGRGGGDPGSPRPS